MAGLVARSQTEEVDEPRKIKKNELEVTNIPLEALDTIVS